MATTSPSGRGRRLLAHWHLCERLIKHPRPCPGQETISTHCTHVPQALTRLHPSPTAYTLAGPWHPPCCVDFNITNSLDPGGWVPLPAALTASVGHLFLHSRSDRTFWRPWLGQPGAVPARPWAGLTADSAIPSFPFSKCASTVRRTPQPGHHLSSLPPQPDLLRGRREKAWASRALYHPHSHHEAEATVPKH